MIKTDEDELYEAVCRVRWAAMSIAEKLASQLTEAIEVLQEFIDEYLADTAEALSVITREIGKALAKERSHAASARRPEICAAKPIPPKKKRLRTFRCRSCC